MHQAGRFGSQLQRISVLAFVSLLSLTGLTQAATPNISQEPLGAERTAIYRDFLHNYTQDDGDAPPLNLERMTTPILADASVADTCTEGFTLQPAGAPIHPLSREILGDAHAKLIDASRFPNGAVSLNAAGGESHFILSEIVFNADHTRALFTYSLLCGADCGNGSMAIYELKAGKWQASSQHCHKWTKGA